MFTRIARILVPVGAVLAAAATPVSAQCPPAEPSHVGATNGSQCNGVLVDWNTVTGANHYEIFRSTSQGSTGLHIADSVGDQYLDITALPGVHYWYRVRAFRIACLPPNNVGPFAGPNEGWRSDGPGTPQNVWASDGEYCAGVEVVWDLVPGAATYQVYRNTVNNFASANLIGIPPTTAFVDLNAIPGMQFYYWVRAVNPCGTSGTSTPDTGFFGTPTPANLRAEVGGCVSTSSIGLSVGWDGTGIVPVSVYRSTSQTFATASQVGLSIVGFWFDATAVPQSIYYYWVRTETPCGSSATIGPEMGQLGSVLGAPENLAATAGTTCNSVKLTWDAATGVPAVEEYSVLRASTSVLSLAQEVGTVAAPLTSYTDATVQSGVSYYYWVRAVNACGDGLASVQPVSWEVPGPVAIVIHPEPVTVYAGQSASFSVSAAGTGELSYAWRRNGELLVNGGPISGANATQLVINPVSSAHAGNYTVTVSDACTNATSNPGALTVLCYPDCNASGSLTVADFGCFQGKYVLGDLYADCNASGNLTVADFGCFQGKYVIGCP